MCKIMHFPLQAERQRHKLRREMFTTTGLVTIRQFGLGLPKAGQGLVSKTVIIESQCFHSYKSLFIKLVFKSNFGSHNYYREEELCEMDNFQEHMTTMLEKTIGKVPSFSLSTFSCQIDVI